MKPRAVLILALNLGFLAAPFAAQAQQAEKVYRVGFLGYAATCDRPYVMTPFREGLRALGYIEGQNIVFEYRGGGAPTPDQLAGLAAELVRLKVDTIVTDGTASALAAKRATSSIPIVMVYVADPVGSGLVSSLARPGGNVTGYSVLSPGIVQKALAILKEIVPRTSRVGVRMDPTNPGQTLLNEQMDAAANILGITLRRIDVRSAASLDGAFAATPEQKRVEALFVYPLPIPSADRQKIAQFAIKNRLPTVTISPPYIEAGMLVAYGVSGADLYRRAATYVDKVPKGAKPGDLPVEQPTKFELLINMKTANALGVTIPPSLLLRADQVIDGADATSETASANEHRPIHRHRRLACRHSRILQDHQCLAGHADHGGDPGARGDAWVVEVVSECEDRSGGQPGEGRNAAVRSAPGTGSG